MKYLITGLCLFTLVLSGNAQSTKKALLIGVGKYQYYNHWKSLSSANDIVYLEQALLHQKFDKKNITTLVDEKATYDGILNALNALAASAKKGDIIFFHFSGHGQQIEDNGNRDEIDGYDEALIPYDAKGKYDPVTYNGEKHLRDDVLQPILKQIRDALGPDGSLVVSLDACHSGTATRSAEFAVTRGEASPFKSPEYKPSFVHNVKDGFADEGASAANMIVLSAASPNQLNYETMDVNAKGVGSLSYALARALSELPANSNYNMLFNRIKSEIQSNHPIQWPMMEGNGSQEIFGNKYVAYDDIIEVTWEPDNQTFRIPAGTLQGITPTTTIDLYITGKDGKVLTAKPITVGNFETVARAEQPVKSKVGYQAKWESSIGSFDAVVFINTGLGTKPSATLNNQLKNFIAKQPSIRTGSTADFMLDINDTNPGKLILSLIEKGDSVRWSRTLTAGDTLTEKDKEALLSNLRYSMKAKFLRELQDGGALTENLVVEIVPRNPVTENGVFIMKRNDAFDIHITNKSSNELFYTIIDLLPDNKHHVLIPDPGLKAEEFRLAPNSATVKLEGFTVDHDTPFGTELFKVIVSRKPMDLRKVFTGVRDRGPGDMLGFESAIQTMVDESSTGTRSGRTNVQVGEVGILTTGFIISK